MINSLFRTRAKMLLVARELTSAINARVPSSKVIGDCTISVSDGAIFVADALSSVSFRGLEGCVSFLGEYEEDNFTFVMNANRTSVRASNWLLYHTIDSLVRSDTTDSRLLYKENFCLYALLMGVMLSDRPSNNPYGVVPGQVWRCNRSDMPRKDFTVTSLKGDTVFFNEYSLRGLRYSAKSHRFDGSSKGYRFVKDVI